MSLRNTLIRVAFENPDLRGTILPYVKEAKDLPSDVERYVKEHTEQGMDEGKAWAVAWSQQMSRTREAKGEVPEAFKKQWKDEDKDNDGKKNEPKPDFLKEKGKKAADLLKKPLRDITDEDVDQILADAGMKIPGGAKRLTSGKRGYTYSKGQVTVTVFLTAIEIRVRMEHGGARFLKSEGEFSAGQWKEVLGAAKDFGLNNAKTAAGTAPESGLPVGDESGEGHSALPGQEKEAALRARAIRLAHENPRLRPHLLPLLRAR